MKKPRKISQFEDVTFRPLSEAKLHAVTPKKTVFHGVPVTLRRQFEAGIHHVVLH